jgi:hypothetical protein
MTLYSAGILNEIYLRKRKPVAPQYRAVRVPYRNFQMVEGHVAGSWLAPYLRELQGTRPIKMLIGWDAWGSGLQGPPRILVTGDFVVNVFAPEGPGDVFGVSGQDFLGLFREVPEP